MNCFHKEFSFLYSGWLPYTREVIILPHFFHITIFLMCVHLPDGEEQGKHNREYHLDIRPGGEAKDAEHQQLH